ncbi:MAG: FAD-dependent monooxygenase [Sphingomonadaceae bacterium]
MSAPSIFDGALILGGGPAGAAAAIQLARAGRAVQVWEREPHPVHRPCCGVLSPTAQKILSNQGIDLNELSAASAAFLHIVTDSGARRVPLGLEARMLTRHRLDAALLDRAQEAGADVRRGVVFRGIGEDGAVLSGHGALRPATLLVATGLEGAPGLLAPPILRDNRIAFQSLWRLRPAARTACQGQIEWLLFDGGYALLHLVEREAASLCVIVSSARLATVGGGFQALIAAIAAEVPLLAQRLEGAVPLVNRPRILDGLPLPGFYRPDADTLRQVWRVGEQVARLPPGIGDGLGLALLGARMTVRALLTGETPLICQRRIVRHSRSVMRHSIWLDKHLPQNAAGRRAMLRLMNVPGIAPLATRLTRLKAPGGI